MAQTFELHVPFRKLLIGLIVTVVPINLFVIYSITESSNRIEATVGNHFRAIAESIASETSSFIQAKVIEASLMASDTAVIEAAKAANGSYRGMSEQGIADRINAVEEVWNRPQGEVAVRRVLSSPASAALRRQLAFDGSFLRVTVTDERGATIAATHKTVDYNQADEDYWTSIYANGRGAISLTDVLYDEASKSSYIGVGVPVIDDSHKFIGTFDTLIDVAALTPILRRSELGSSGRVLLVKGDSTVIAASFGAGLSAELKSAEHDAVMDAMSTIYGRQTGYVVADLPGEGDALIGFADTGLKQDYRNLDWAVVVAQRSSQAFAPVLATQRLIMVLALISLAGVVFMGVYVALHRKSEIEEIEEDMSHRATTAAP